MEPEPKFVSEFAIIFPWIALLFVVLSTCDQKPNPRIEWPEGADWDVSFSRCGAICDHLAKLKCAEAADKTPSGVGCEKSCQVLIERGIWEPSDLECILRSTAPEEVRACKLECKVANQAG